MKQCKLFIQNTLIGIFYSIKLLFAKLVRTKTSICRAKWFSLFCQYCRVIPDFSVWYFLLSVICVIVTQLKLQIYSKSYLQLKKSAIQSSSSIQFLFYSSTQKVIYSLRIILHKLTIVQSLNNILGKITEEYRKQ